MPLRNTNPARFITISSQSANLNRYLVAPIAPSVALAALGGLSAGGYRWLLTFVTYDALGNRIGETDAGVPSLQVIATAGQRGVISNIPVDVWSPPASIGFTRIRLYRTLANGSVFRLVTEWAANTPTDPYADTATDASIANNEVPPTTNGSGGLSAPLAPHGLLLSRFLPAPPAPTVAIGAGGGALSTAAVGAYRWLVTFVNGHGETIAGTSAANGTAVSDGDRAVLTNIVTGDVGTLARNVYRTTAGGTTFKFAFTINNNTDTSAVDTVADTALGGVPPIVNTTGGSSYTIYLSNFTVNDGSLDSILNDTRGHLVSVIDANTIELSYTDGAELGAISTGTLPTGDLLIGYRRIAFPIRFRSLDRGEETNRITPV
jgi:hypothetical protein